MGITNDPTGRTLPRPCDASATVTVLPLPPRSDQQAAWRVRYVRERAVMDPRPGLQRRGGATERPSWG